MESPETKNLLGRLNITYAAIVALLILLVGLALLIIPGVLSVSHWTDVARQIAGVLIPTGLIGFVYEIRLRREFLKEVSSELESLLKGRLATGGISVHRSLLDQTIALRFERASKRVKILQTWMGNYIEIESSLKTAADQDCEIKVLLLNPNSHQAVARSQDLGHPDDYVAGAIISNLRSMVNLCKKYNGLSSKIKLSLYDSTPIMTLYWYDDTCYMGLFWKEGNAIAKPQIEIDMRDSYFGKDVESHFSNLWQDERTISIDLSKPIDDQLR
jgi:hypothetical protein